MFTGIKRIIGQNLRQIKNHLLSSIDYIRFCYHNYKYRFSRIQWNYVIFDHNLGGGATQFLNEKLDNDWEFRKQAILIRYLDQSRGYKVDIIQNRNVSSYMVPSYNRIKMLLSKFNFSCIFVNELFEYENIYRWLALLEELKEQKNCDLIYLLHDYYCICPVASLAVNSERFCNLDYDCGACLKKVNYDLTTYGDIREWRKNWKNFLTQCTKIIAFSKDTKKRIQDVYGDIPVDIIPHTIYKELRKVKVKKNNTHILHVGILGNLSKIKGVDIIKQMIEYVRLSELPIRFILIGDVYGENITESSKFCKTGKYSREELPQILEKNKIDIVFVASVIPETFSYTTHEAVMMNIPIACFDLGAQAECVKEYDKGIIIPRIDYKVAVQSLLTYLEETNNVRL